MLNEKLPDEKECLLIDEELDQRTGSEIAAAWQNLCGMLVAETCKLLRRKYIRNKSEVFDKKRARQWLEGNECVISFEDTCNTLGIDKERTKTAIKDYAETPIGSAINRSVLVVLTQEE